MVFVIQRLFYGWKNIYETKDNYSSQTSIEIRDKFRDLRYFPITEVNIDTTPMYGIKCSLSDDSVYDELSNGKIELSSEDKNLVLYNYDLYVAILQSDGYKGMIPKVGYHVVFEEM